jgi:cobalt-zinc-cadmium resistance protein CzcA
VPGVADLGVFRVLGQPNVDISVDRAQADRYGINVADVQDAIQTAVGGNPVSQILMGDQRFDLVPRYQPQFRGHHRPDQEHSPAGAQRRAGLVGSAL